MLSRILAGLFLCGLLSSCSHKEEPAQHARSIVGVDTLPRASITFILGKDENPRNPYYALADQYYRLSDSEKTETVIDTIFSLAGILNYLAHNPARNGRPWGMINLVSHGNEFIDLSVPVSLWGPRVSVESIEQAMRDTVLRPLDSTIVDSRTLVNLHGCAVGNNTALLRMLGLAFGGAHPLSVKASRMFEYYGNTSSDGNPQFIRHYYARAWYAFFHPDSIPSDSELAARFKARYPAAAVDWDQAVQRYHPANPSEEYNLRMVIPVSWEDFYRTRSEMPDVRSKSRREQWVAGKPEFQALMDKTSIPRQYFQIKFFSDTYSNDSGSFFSLRVKARAGVVCVVKPVLSLDTGQRNRYAPYIPASNDTVFFGFSAKPS